MIYLLDVMIIDDETVDPPHPKIVVCVNEKENWFFRINSKDTIRPCVSLSKSEHVFLAHDSFLDCILLELDDYIIQDSIARNRVIGAIGSSVIGPMIDMVAKSWTLRDFEKDKIIELLQSVL